MFTLVAPYPAMKTTSLLPNPTFSDSEGLTDTISTRTAVDGTLYTYVKRKNSRRKYQWTFRLTRNKALELRAFLQLYFASTVRVIDHHGAVIVGMFTNNPFEFESERKAGPAIAPMPRGETQTIQIDFEGVPQ